MKVIVLGGTGDMGKQIVRDLVEYSDFKEIIIGDIREELAKEFADSLKDKRLSVMKVDARDHSALVKVLKNADVAASAIGPFYEFGPKIMKAALDAGINCVDICDDWEPVETILSFNKEAKDAGVTLLTGMGWTPGISNLCAKDGADKLDKVEKINIAWAGSVADSSGLAVIKHVFYAITGKVPSFIDGKREMVKAGSGKVRMEFPQPIGKLRVYHIGHPEPCTIPLYIKSPEVTLRGALTPEWTNNVAAFLAGLGLTKSNKRKDSLARLTQRLEGGWFGKVGKDVSGLRVDVTGEKKGKKRRHTYLTADKMARLTGIPCSIGAQMFAGGEVKAKGAIPPEACVEPKKFFAELDKRKVKIEYKEEEVK